MPRYVKDGYAIETCPHCGLTQLHPMPPPEELQGLYEGDYFANRASQTGYDEYAEQETEYAATFREEAALLGRFVSSGRVLDVGCGYGYFLDAAKAAGYEPYGIDVSGPAVSEAAKRLPGHVYHGDIRDCPKLEPAQFEAVFVSHLIEHIGEPVPFVKALGRVLKPEGAAVFLTPNIDSVLARISRSRWVSLKVPEHVAYYNPVTFRRLLERADLDLVAVENAHQYYRLAFVGRKLRELTRPLSSLAPPLEQSRLLSGRILRIPNGSMRIIARKRGEPSRSKKV